MGFNPIEWLVKQVAPYACMICSRSGEILCEACRQTNFDAPESRCYICNKLTNQNQLCASHKAVSRLRRVWWLANYEEPLKSLIWRLKFHRARDFGRTFGRLLDEQLPYLTPETVVVPISTASSRVRRRGFDQAYVIARSFAASRGLILCQALLRQSQADQVGLRRAERMKNMRSAFKLSDQARSKIKNQNVILIDDVLTTGATLEAAAAILREAGAKHVDGAVIARKLLS